jgi:hypothetical protein
MLSPAPLKLSLSWLAKARMHGHGPPYIKGRSVYSLQRGHPAPVDEVPTASVDKRALIAARIDREECGSIVSFY